MTKLSFIMFLGTCVLAAWKASIRESSLSEENTESQEDDSDENPTKWIDDGWPVKARGYGRFWDTFKPAIKNAVNTAGNDLLKLMNQ